MECLFLSSHVALGMTIYVPTIILLYMYSFILRRDVHYRAVPDKAYARNTVPWRVHRRGTVIMGVHERKRRSASKRARCARMDFRAAVF